MSDSLPFQPHMDEEGLACFKNTIASTRSYLEYGAGGSTLYANAIAKVPIIITVDSDREWAARVARSIDKSVSKTFITHCDIGEVGDWGIPKSNEKFSNFWQYTVAPWEVARKNSCAPDTILIDGRFRVSCFLYSLMVSRAGTTILFDDYFDRPEYFAVEEFCRVHERHGRMGVFMVSNQYDLADLVKKIAQYSVVWV